MKKWIKKYSKCLVTGVAILAIMIASWGIHIATEEWAVALHTFAIAIWVMILLFNLGVIARVSDWWDKE